MAQLQKIQLPPIQNGIVQEGAVDESLTPPNTAQFIKNLNCDRIGALTLRNGLTLVGSQISSGNDILGMANYINNARTTFRLLAKVGTNVYDYDGSSWNSVRSGLTASSKARFTNFIDKTFMVNGDEATQQFDGSSFSATSLHTGDYIENYRNRVWIADKATDKVYYTNVVTTSNTLTGGTSFLQISPQDGEQITGLKRHSQALLVFKNNHIYRVFTPNSVDPDPYISRGTYSQESIVEGKDGIYYHHPTGFYRFSFAQSQNEISRPIIAIIKAVPRAYYEKVCGWFDDDHYYWSIGDITLEGVSFTNIVCRYTVSTQIWTIYSYSSEIRSASSYDSGTTLYPVVGDDDGNVLRFNYGNTDNGNPIHYDLITHWQYFTNIKSTVKSITEISTLHENALGGVISYQIDTDLANRWTPINGLTKDLYQIDKLNAKDFTRIRFRFSGNSQGMPFIFRGWELLNMLTEGEIKKK